jgi:CubicO group peptidase (beta-lactamase class C family)
MIAPLANLVSIKRVAEVMVCSMIALCTASGQQREQKPTTIVDLRNAIEAVLHETRTPGAGIAIVSRDEIEWAAGLGVADVARNRAATAETLFRIGSI